MNNDVVIRVENLSKQYRLGLVGTGTLSHDLNRWWHRVHCKEDPYLKVTEINDRTKRRGETGNGKRKKDESGNGSLKKETNLRSQLSGFKSQVSAFRFHPSSGDLEPRKARGATAQIRIKPFESQQKIYRSRICQPSMKQPDPHYPAVRS